MPGPSKGAVILVANDVITPKIWPGGKGFFCAEATWGGGSVKLQVKMPNGTYADVASSTLSANGGLMVELPAGDVKAVVATATAVYARLVNIP